MKLVTAVLLLMATLSARSNFAAEGELIPFDVALNLIKEQEENNKNRISNASWAFSIKLGRLSVPSGEIEFTPLKEGLWQEHRTTFSPATGRYRYTTKGVFEWVDGTAPQIATEEAMAFDGKIETTYLKSKKGDELPSPDSKGQGIIRKENFSRFIQQFGTSSGIGFFHPYHFNRPFWEFLKNNKDAGELFSIVSKDGVWIIETSPHGQSLKDDTLLRIFYDPKKGLVKGGEWESKVVDKSHPGKIWKTYSIQYKQFEGGIVVPETITMINLLDKVVSRLEFTEIEINKSVPNEIYTLSFPPGTAVDNDIERLSYVVSSGIHGEREKIVRFSEANNLGEDRGSWSSWFGWNLISYVGAFLGILLAFCVLWLWRSGKVMLLVVSSLSAARLVNGSDFDNGGNWKVAAGENRSHSITQCGFNVAVFSLEYFKKRYDLKIASKLLPPGPDGIKMADIKNLLLSHGLDVVARDAVSLRELKSSLKPNMLALFPVRIGEKRYHYFVCTEKNNKAVLIDPPIEVKDLEGAIGEETFRSMGGLVLFITNKSQAKIRNQSESAVFDPGSLNLGQFRQKTPALSVPVVKDIKCTNTGLSPIGIAKISASCGCINVELKNILIKPGESVPVSMTSIMSAWLTGKTTKTIKFEFFDGSSKELEIGAELLPPEEIQGVELESKLVRLYFDEGNPPRRYEASIGIDYSKGKYAQLDFEKKCDWLDVNIKQTSETTGVVSLSVINEKLPVDFTRLHAPIDFWIVDKKNPVQLDFYFERAKWFTFVDSMPATKAGEPLTIKCVSKIKIDSLQLNKNQGSAGEISIKVNEVRNSASNFSLTFIPSANTRPGFHIATINVILNSAERIIRVPLEILK